MTTLTGVRSILALTVPLVLAAALPLCGAARGGPLHAAAAAGEVEAIRALLAGGTAVDEPDRPGGATALQYAVAAGQVEAVRALLEAGAEADVRDVVGRTPLMHAVRDNDLDVGTRIALARVLLQGGADPNAAALHGRTALHLTMDPPDKAAISWVEILADAGADLNAASNAGMTPLMVALVEGADAGVVRAMVRARASTDARDRRGSTPLHWALRVPGSGSVERIEILIDADADVNAANDAGWTPLMEAARFYDSQAMLLLLREGADPNARNAEGSTPLLIALAASQETPWRDWLRDGTIDIDPPELDDDVRMLAGIYHDALPKAEQVGIVWILLSHGARSDARADDGTTVESLLEGRDDPDAAAIRRLLEVAHDRR
jgi:ankyrin repeat protein